jgi:TFIIF-interacting CTD phosphatase-like protein
MTKGYHVEFPREEVSLKKEGDRINCVLDLDNSIISSLSMAEIKKAKSIDKRKLTYHTMEGYYRIYSRPHLQEFLDYAFANFNVSIWTAASRDYASFIIENIILSGHPERKLKMFLYDENCDESQRFYNENTPKDLRYLYNFEGFYPCNTVIIDDLSDVYKANPKQTIRAPYFDAKKDASEKDAFLLDAIKYLKELKERYERGGCAYHKHHHNKK